MKFERVSWNQVTEGLASRQQGRREENNPRREVLMRALKRAVEEELTPRQRECLIAYYFEGQKAHEIALALKIRPSTVSRHLKKARERLGRVLQYGFFANMGED